MRKFLLIIWLPVVIGLAASCEDQENPDEPSLPDDAVIPGNFGDPEPYTFDIPSWVNAQPIIPEDNPMTIQGVSLGRRLFYDPLLSVDGSTSCASCHQLDLAFTDGVAKSKGVIGVELDRNSMPLFNLAFNPSGFFWDGRSKTLEEQALLPVEDHRELAEDWDNVIRKLQADNLYPELFKQAFGIERMSEITKELTVKAIAQFERTLISANSKEEKS